VCQGARVPRHLGRTCTAYHHASVRSQHGELGDSHTPTSTANKREDSCEVISDQVGGGPRALSRSHEVGRAKAGSGQQSSKRKAGNSLQRHCHRLLADKSSLDADTACA